MGTACCVWIGLKKITFSYADKAGGERHFKRFSKERSLITNWGWLIVVEWTEIRRYHIRKTSVMLLINGSCLSCLLNCCPRSSSSWPPLAYIVDDNLHSFRIRWEECWNRRLWSNLRCYPGIGQEKLRKAMTNFIVICLRAEIRTRNSQITKQECFSLAAGSSLRCRRVCSWPNSVTHVWSSRQASFGNQRGWRPGHLLASHRRRITYIAIR